MFHFPIGCIGSFKKLLDHHPSMEVFPPTHPFSDSLGLRASNNNLFCLKTVVNDIRTPIVVSGALRSATALGPNLVNASVAAKRYLLWEVF